MIIIIYRSIYVISYVFLVACEKNETGVCKSDLYGGTGFIIFVTATIGGFGLAV